MQCLVTVLVIVITLHMMSAFKIAKAGSPTTTTASRLMSASRYSIPDQELRFATAVKENNKRVLDIDSVYNPTYLKGKTALVTGGNRGLGLSIAKELMANGANVIITSRAATTIEGADVIEGIELQDNQAGSKIVDALKGRKVDILINSAGYFYEPVETIESMNFEEQLKQIDICGVAPLRVSSAMFNAGALSDGAKIIIITSQAGSVEWRSVQNPTGADYGHHMSRAACNMGGKLLSQELKHKGITVALLHPGFNKTDMTKKYAAVWEINGAVDPSVGAKRVVQEIGLVTLEKTGIFINCEDGLEIPW
jgi:NAD(P)-dependent dehydrogenase (short-subunit alcohol dehydrogenase family)